MKYKIGDRVMIRADLERGSQEGTDCHMHVCMLQYTGKLATITSLRGISERYSIDLDGGEWAWASEFFTSTDDLPDTLVVNGIEYNKASENPFKPITIEIKTLDEAKVLWHRLNAAAGHFEEYAGQQYSNMVFLDRRANKSQMWACIEQSLRKRGIELDYTSASSY